MVYKILASFTPNFGVSPFESKTDDLTSYKVILFAFVFDGLVLWIAYQSFLYPELSKVITKDPFNDLDSLANSDYKCEDQYFNICYICHVQILIKILPSTFHVLIGCILLLKIMLITIH